MIDAVAWYRGVENGSRGDRGKSREQGIDRGEGGRASEATETTVELGWFGKDFNGGKVRVHAGRAKEMPAGDVNDEALSTKEV